MSSAAIPNRQLFRAQEVCEIAQVQPYVLRSWEAEFPELGTSKTAKGQRVYRRGDVERVLLLKQLVFSEGLTLAGARKRLAERGDLTGGSDADEEVDVAAFLDEEARESLRDVQRGLKWVLGVLEGNGVAPEDFVLVADEGAGAAKGKGQRAKGKGEVGGKRSKGSSKTSSKASSGTSAKTAAGAARKKAKPRAAKQR